MREVSVCVCVGACGAGLAPPRHGSRSPDMADYINGRLRDVDSDPNCPPYESVREYAYEGDGSTAGSLSSMGSRAELSDDDDEWTEHLGRLGPPFDWFNDE